MSLDPNKRWLKSAVVDKHVVRVWCGPWPKHVDRLRCFQNISDTFVKGSSGACFKKDALSKHVSWDAHNYASRGIGEGTARGFVLKDRYWQVGPVFIVLLI